ncbi:hypothetical protein [Micromonospora sp. NPDC007230]|uniref:hypothetical protein n=1 Tax=Micromonospora sp. NPDC007230 TaxID=3364237 RepID=UPI0036812EF8
MVAALVGEHWNTVDVQVLASGVDAGGRRLPSNAWMALRRLGWTATPPPGVRVNDRVVRMAQEQAGRALRSAAWRAEVTAGVLAAWPSDPRQRTPVEWDQVRASIPGGEYLSASIIKGRTRQVAAFVKANGRLPVDVFELEGVPRIPRMLLLAACDRQQASIERCGTDPARALLRLQLPSRPDPRTYRDWTAGTAKVLTGDATGLLDLVPASAVGRVSLVLTSPPYGRGTHGLVRVTSTGYASGTTTMGTGSVATSPMRDGPACSTGSPRSSPPATNCCVPAGPW